MFFVEPDNGVASGVFEGPEDFTCWGFHQNGGECGREVGAFGFTNLAAVLCVGVCRVFLGESLKGLAFFEASYNIFGEL